MSVCLTIVLQGGLASPLMVVTVSPVTHKGHVCGQQWVYMHTGWVDWIFQFESKQCVYGLVVFGIVRLEPGETLAVVISTFKNCHS